MIQTEPIIQEPNTLAEPSPIKIALYFETKLNEDYLKSDSMPTNIELPKPNERDWFEAPIY